MKKLVWSETSIEGGKSFKRKLPKPPSTTGTFQNIPLGQAMKEEMVVQNVEFYKDAP